MVQIPKRHFIAKSYRPLMDKLEKYMIFPFKNPSHYQVVGLLLSICYLYAKSPATQSLILGTILILDWMDGAAARKYNLASREGWIIDVFVDRISEGFIFTPALFSPLGTIFFLLYILNIFLSIFSVKTGIHFILPVRFYWLLILIAKIWII